MGARKDFITGGHAACIAGTCRVCDHNRSVPPLACSAAYFPHPATPIKPDDTVIRVGSPIEVWNPDGGYWASSEVDSMPGGVRGMDGVLVQAFGDPRIVRFIPWTLIRQVPSLPCLKAG